MTRKCRNFQSFLQDLQTRMLDQAGMMPGKFDDMFGSFFNPEIRKLLSREDLNRAENVTDADCHRNRDCPRFLFLAKSFIYKIYFLFPRPFFRLGTLISVFEYKIFPNDKFTMRPVQSQLYRLLAELLSEYYDQKVANVPLTDLASWATMYYLGALKRPNYTLAYADCDVKDYVKLYLQLIDYTKGKTGQMPCPNGSGPCCNQSQALVRDNFDFFLNYIRLSSSTKDKDFYEKYVKNLTAWKKFNLSLEENVDDLTPAMLVHCEFVSELVNIDRTKLGCKKFRQVPTPYGLCHSYNTLAPGQLFKPSGHSQHLDNAFKWKPVEELERPSGHGSSNGFYIVLSAFEVSAYQRVTKDFLVSISNADNYFNVDHSYTVKPGNFYTFSVITSQVVTTPTFDVMSRDTRRCALPEDNGNMKYLKNNSRSGCGFECMVEMSKERCGCAPWNFPRMSMDEPFCDIFGNVCVGSLMDSMDKKLCDCDNDCSKTTFTIFESSTPIVADMDICYALIALQGFVGNRFLAYHLYNYIVRGLPDPTEMDFCFHLLKNEVAIVKIEMATGSVIRSVKDKRITFESQLASLG